MTQDFKKLKKKWVFFLLLVTFEILSHYPNIDCYLWLNDDGQWLIDKNFIDKFMG